MHRPKLAPAMTLEEESSTDPSPENGVVNSAYQPDVVPEKNEKNGTTGSLGEVVIKEPNGTTGSLGEVVIKEPEHETRCGLFGWRPSCLKYVNNSKVMLAVMCWFSACQGFAVNGINNVNTTSLERRFFLTSTQVSLISSSYDIAAGIFVLPIGYYGRLGNKPRWLAAAAACMACGSFVMTLPHFITTQYIAQTNISDTCPADPNTMCDGSGLSNYLYLFMAGQFLHGIGGTTLYTLGVTYLDENVKMYHSPIFIGIFEAFAALGPALGYLIGGLFLDIYVDFDSLPKDSVTIDSEDPRWVGAWWIGFLITSGGFLTIASMLFLFGWELPEAEENRKSKVSQAHADGSEKMFEKHNFGVTLKDMPKVTWLLIKNPAFMFLTAAGTLSSLCSSGFATFLPKFIQTQFSVTASWAALLTGFVIIPSGVFGQIAGGIVPGKLKWGVKAIIRYMGIAMVIGTLCTPMFLLKCSPNVMAGVSHHYMNNTEVSPQDMLLAPCNAACNCTKGTREPVCDSQGVEYFTACYAGCTASGLDANGTKTFTNCGCTGTVDQETTPGKCPTDCGFLPLFLVLLFVLVFTVMLCIPAGVVGSIRSVPANQGAFALAIQWLFVRFLATIPGPILYGSLVDMTCIVWQDRCTEADGSCWQYDQFNLSINFMTITLVVLIFICACYFMAQLLYKEPGKAEPLDDETESKNGGLDNDAFSENSTTVTKL